MSRRSAPAGEAADKSVPDLTGNLAAPLGAAAAALGAAKLDEAVEILELLLKTHHDCSEAHVMLGDALRARGHNADARDHYVLAGCFKPGWWLPSMREGLLAFDEDQFEEAIAALTQALKLGANDATVHNTLGAAYFEVGQLDSAVEHFERALALKPNFAEAHSNLGYLLFREKEQLEEGARHLEAALRLQPDSAEASCNWVMVLMHRGRMNEALELCNQLLARDPSIHEAALSRGLIRLSKGEYSGGWSDYEMRKRVRSNYHARTPPWPEWSGSLLRGKSIYVQTEQGLGDEIMFASCLPELIAEADKCICECSPKLQEFFRRSFPRAVIVGKDSWCEPGFPFLHTPDFYTTLGSLPRFMRNSSRDFPIHRGYLYADPNRVEHWRANLIALPGRKKVGISWRGGAKSTRGALRSIPLARWSPILTLPDIDFISLQYSDCDEELAEVRRLGVRIEHWQDAIDDYDETAALLSALDLVVSVQTAVVHLAGALGAPVWALISAVPEWRYGLDGETMPWYPKARLIRQATLGEWDPIIVQVQRELAVWACESG